MVGVFELATLVGVTESATGVIAVAGEAVNTLLVLGLVVVVAALGAPSRIGSGDAPAPRPATGEADTAPRPAIGDGDRTDGEPNTDDELTEADCSTVEGEGAAGLRFLLSKSAKLAKPPPPPLLSPNASDDDAAGFVGVGPCNGRGGAGLGGGCFAFFGGNAGLGDSGRGGATDLLGLGVSI